MYISSSPFPCIQFNRISEPALACSAPSKELVCVAVNILYFARKMDGSVWGSLISCESTRMMTMMLRQVHFEYARLWPCQCTSSIYFDLANNDRGKFD